MHAPATPGTSDSGSAAGSDSEQGSGPIEQPVEKVTLTLNCDNDFVSAPSGAGTFDKGTTVTIEAVAEDETPVSGGGQTQYTFKNWSDGSTERVRSIVLSEDLTLTANYQQNYVMM